MKGNLHVRFLGGWRVVTPSGYPVACGFYRTRLSTFDCSPWGTMKRRFPFLQFHRCPPVYSLRVHWIPLFPSSQRLGAFALSPHPGVPSFPGFGLLCPIRLSSLASRFREAFPPHYFPTALGIHRGVSRVPHGRLRQNEVGGVFLSLPQPLFAAPQALDRG